MTTQITRCLKADLCSASAALKAACHDVCNLSRQATQLKEQHQADQAAALVNSKNIHAQFMQATF
jgi:hypothetical protein